MNRKIPLLKHIYAKIIWSVSHTADKCAYRLRKYTHSTGDGCVHTVREKLCDVFPITPEISDSLRESVRAAAMKTLANEWYVLHQYRDSIYDEKTKHYWWLTDYKTGYTYPTCYFSKIRSDDASAGSDIKRVWELSRLQFLFAPALYWYITKDESYAAYVCGVLNDWVDGNPYEEGPNWNNAMEVAIRAVNIVLVMQLLLGCAALTERLYHKISVSLHYHRRYITHNLENYCGITYNHYVADILGILAITAAFPKQHGAKRKFRYAIRAFETEIRKQMLSDGGLFEGSTCYHCLSGEMFALAALIYGNTQHRFSDGYYYNLRKIMSFAVSLRKRSGNMIQIGDNDSGRILQLIPYEALNYDAFLGLAQMVLSESGEPRNLTSIFESEYQIAYENHVYVYPNSGILVFRDDILYCTLCAPEPQKNGLGGHTHNDKLSMELNYKGKDFFVDAGSGVYSSDLAVHTAFRSVSNHSTASFNGCEQNMAQTVGLFGLSYDAQAVVSAIVDTKTVFYGELNVTHSGLSYTQTREVIFSGDEIVEIRDTIRADQVGNVYYRFILHPDVIVEVIQNEAIMKNGDVMLKMIGENAFRVETGYYSDLYDTYRSCKVLNLTKPLNKEISHNRITVMEYRR